jgi:hypothetical protein
VEADNQTVAIALGEGQMNNIRFETAANDTVHSRRTHGSRRHHKRAGLSFIEVFFAIFMVVTAALMFSGLVPLAVKSEKMMGSYQQATSILQHKIDQLRGVGWGRLTFAELSDAGIIDATPTASPYSFKTVDNLNSYYRSATGTITVTDFSTTIRQVTVTLVWTGSNARQGNGTLTVTALIAKG